MPAWALLILAPRSTITDRLVHSAAWPVTLGLFYLIAMGLSMFAGVTGNVAFEGAISFTTIEGVRNIFGSDMGVFVGWSHYLVFDLFVGMWEARDARRCGFSHLLLIPCLLLTYMLGPVGLLLYLCLRFITKKGGWALHE